MTSPADALAQTSFTAPAPGFGGGKVGPQHFGDFSDTGALESTPHNAIHVVLVNAPPVRPCRAGLMIDPNCAALDPIFWLHHANIDRLWNVWLAQGGGRDNPPDGSWRDQSFDFYDENGDEVSMTVAEVLDSAGQLDYVYDDEPATAMPSRPQSGAPEAGGPPPELVAATEQPLTLTGAPKSVPISVPPDTRGGLESAAAPRPRPRARERRRHPRGDQPRRRLRRLPQPARARAATAARTTSATSRCSGSRR